MSRSPVVSVIIPTYNRAILIKRAICSVLEQSFQNLEVLVIDDASTDATAKVVAEIRDPRVCYIQQSQNRGGGAARNAGLSVARGDFIAFQDSDNEWLPDKLGKQMALLLASPDQFDAVYSGFWKVKEHRKSYFPYHRFKKREGDIHQALLWENFIDTSSLLVKRECFEQVGGFDERLPRFQDWELCLRLSKLFAFGFVDEPLHLAHYQRHSISTNREAAVQALLIIREKNNSEISADAKLQAHFDHWLGLCYAEMGKKRQAVGYLLKAVYGQSCCLRYYVSIFVAGVSPAALTRLVSAYQLIRNRNA
jgi:glycosyltransferase involved in cell wall biosynthesis